MPRIIITLLTFIALFAGDLQGLDLRGFENLGGLVRLGGLAATANAAEPPTAPILRIETGRHTAMIRRIDVDRSGRWLVSGSDDKTVRVWDVNQLRILSVHYNTTYESGDML